MAHLCVRISLAEILERLERVNQELKRRTRVARVFPNEQSLLRLISALLAETSDDWETGNIYLNMENQNPPSV